MNITSLAPSVHRVLLESRNILSGSVPHMNGSSTLSVHFPSPKIPEVSFPYLVRPPAPNGKRAYVETWLHTALKLCQRSGMWRGAREGPEHTCQNSPVALELLEEGGEAFDADRTAAVAEEELGDRAGEQGDCAHESTQGEEAKRRRGQ